MVRNTYAAFLTELAQVGGLVLIRIISHKALELIPGLNAGNVGPVGPPPLDGVEGLVLGLQPVYSPIPHSFIHTQQCVVVAF